LPRQAIAAWRGGENFSPAARPARKRVWQVMLVMCAVYNRRRLLFAALGAAPRAAADRIGDIEFFGYKGIDLAKIRSALPVREGREYSSDKNQGSSGRRRRNR
jgi:hypothetical protein